MKLLIVDDEIMIARTISRALRRFTVASATTAEEALELLEKRPFDAVIADYALGRGMNGARLLAIVADRWPTMRRVLYSGVSRESPHAHVALLKPATAFDLLKALAEVA